MRLNFVKPHKSITGPVSTQEITDFVILSGPNGSGKSHLLEAITNGAISIDEIAPFGANPRGRRRPNPNQAPDQPIRLFTLGQLVAPEEQAASPAAYRDRWVQLYQQHQQSLRQLRISPTSISPDSEEFERELGLLVLQGRFLTPEALQGMLTVSGKLLSKLEVDDFRRYAPALVGIHDPFKLTVSELFLSYHQRHVRNKFSQWLKETAQPGGDVALSDEEFITRYGPTPWDLLNDTMALVGLEYQLNHPEGAEDNLPYEVQLIHNETGVPIQTSQLSSGEKTLMAIAMCLYAGSRLGEAIQLPQVLLLDEPDASLHPSMARSLLRVIGDMFCKRYGVKVILVTHAPSTVALAPVESLYTMHRAGNPRLRRAISRDQALTGLMVGLPTLSVKSENRRQVFVESDVDEACYQELFRLLKDKISTPFSLEFIASGKAGQGNDIAVKYLVQKLRDSGSHVQGILDRDRRSGAPEGIVFVENRCTLENLVLDPLVMGIFLMREKILTSQDVLGERLRHYEIQAQHAQAVCDYIVSRTRQDGDDEERVSVSYVGGFTASVPRYSLDMNGHALEGRFRSTFPSLNQYKGGRLKARIIELALADVPDCAPQDVIELFRRLSS